MAARLQNDWVSPHKVSLLLLIKYMSSIDEEQEEYSECIRRCRDKLSLLLLEFFEAPDFQLSELCKLLTAVDVSLPGLLTKSLQGLVQNGISGISEFFQSLENLLIGQEPALHKKSLFGLFTRRMALSFHKMSFSQVSHFVDLLRTYMDGCESRDVIEDVDSSMDISMQSVESENNEIISNNVRKPFLQGSVSNRQAEFFLAKQVSLIQSAAEEALSPPELQSSINEILTVSPNIAEAHYASFLNCLRTKEFKEALDSLYHYFDRQQWQGESAASKIICDSEESEAERCHRFRYAALILAALHCRFGHRQEALAALKEAIQIAQETNDHVCLEHCLGWLYRLKQEGSSQAKLLLDRFVARAAELKIPYLTSLGMLSRCQYDAVAGGTPPKVLENLAQINIINSQNSLTDLMAAAQVQQAATWQVYGKGCIAGIFTQFPLQLNASSRQDTMSSVSGSTGIQSAEATCLSLCSLAEQHADRGMFQEATDILSFCRSKFPEHSNLSKLWMAAEAKIDHSRALLQGDLDRAKACVEQLAAVDECEAEYRLALNMLHAGDFTAVFPLLQKLESSRDKVFLNDGNKSAAEYQARILLALAQLFLLLEDPVSALPYALNCLTVSCSHFLDNLAALASLYTAQIQLSLGLPTKAVTLVKRTMVQILSHSSLYVQCCARFLLVKCQLTASNQHEDKSKRENDLRSSLPSLETIVKGFRKLGAINKTRDVLYCQARVYDELGYTIERNACAAECCEILQRKLAHHTRTSLFVL